MLLSGLDVSGSSCRFCQDLGGLFEGDRSDASCILHQVSKSESGDSTSGKLGLGSSCTRIFQVIESCGQMCLDHETRLGALVAWYIFMSDLLDAAARLR